MVTVWLGLCDPFLTCSHKPLRILTPSGSSNHRVAACHCIVVIPSQCSLGKLCHWSCALYNLYSSTDHLCQAKQKGSLGSPSSILYGHLIHLSKVTDYETLSLFPFQSSKSAMVTVPKYIRNVSWILWHFTFPASSSSQWLLLASDILIVHTCKVTILCSVFWAHHLLSHSHCHPQPRQYQIGSSSVENYEQIRKDYSCKMNQAIAPRLALPLM